MQPVDEEALEQAAWSAFTQRLGEHLAGQWPAMPERLGERYDAFIDLAVQQAGKRGLQQAASVARFVNLWFVWGPAFHDKPGFEWAQGILAAPREREWLTVHQLVQRSMLELQRLPDARVEPQALAAADGRVIDVFGPLGRQGRMRVPPEPPPARLACDLEAADLRVLDDGWHQEYRLEGEEWQRLPVLMPAPLRVDAAHPMPALVALLSHQSGQGRQARLQVRLRTHAVCHADVHAGLSFSGPHGRWQWAGHETRAVSWHVATRDQSLPASGPGTVIAEETSPEPQTLHIQTCGLRDEGEAIGPLKTKVSVWPAEQWWIELQRALPAQQAMLPGTRPWARGATRCRVERDGATQDGTLLKGQFEDGLDGAAAVAVQKLAAAWEQLPGLSQARFDAMLAVLSGKMACTWGWRLGPRGLDGAALMRLLALLEMQACEADLQFGGELAWRGSTSRVSLQLAGQAPLRARIERAAPESTLNEALKPALAAWRWPFTLQIEPLAGDAGSLLQQVGPLTGALVGDAGLRSCTHGSSGWEWFASLRLEAVAAPLAVFDPLLGQSRATLALLPAMTLLDWSLG